MIGHMKVVQRIISHAPRQYGLSQQHKHLPEVQYLWVLVKRHFMPIVDDYYSGMEVTWLRIHSRLCRNQPVLGIMQQALETHF